MSGAGGAGLNSLLWSTQFELMLFALACFLVLATDELVVDLLWIVRTAYRRLYVYRLHERATAQSLTAPGKPPRLALFIAAWQESEVIGALLSGALRAYAGHDVTIFVGCYANDAATQQEVSRFSASGVIMALNRKAGPTTKADCLNTIWQEMLAHEEKLPRFDGIIIHDAEDQIDGSEILVLSALLHRFSAIHLPVIPIASRDTRWIGNHYCDEFAEAHIKAQVVREAIGAGLPSAGVGCMFRRDLLDALDADRSGEPFETRSLTEDYELGLTARKLGLSSAFIRIRSAPGGEIVATRARFPHKLDAAIRQKSRWIAGIAIAGWDRTGWGQGAAEIWMRFRDRKSLLSAIALCAGYASFCLWWFGSFLFDKPPSRLSVLPASVLIALWISSALLLWRLAIRFACVTYTYGVREGLWSIPRVVMCNAIAIAASARSIRVHLSMLRSGRVTWDKTEHFPPPPEQP